LGVQLERGMDSSDQLLIPVVEPRRGRLRGGGWKKYLSLLDSQFVPNGGVAKQGFFFSRPICFLSPPARLRLAPSLHCLG
jgi:hypothetical protein